MLTKHVSCIVDMTLKGSINHLFSWFSISISLDVALNECPVYGPAAACELMLSVLAYDAFY